MIEIGGSKEMGWGTAARGGLGGGKVATGSGKVAAGGGESQSRARGSVCQEREREDEK